MTNLKAPTAVRPKEASTRRYMSLWEKLRRCRSARILLPILLVLILLQYYFLARSTRVPLHGMINPNRSRTSLNGLGTQSKVIRQKTNGSKVSLAPKKVTTDHPPMPPELVKYLRIPYNELCDPVPPNLVGHVEPVLTPPALQMIEERFPELKPGGRYTPKHCMARSRVAIIVPYSKRLLHLQIFLYNLHPILQRQQLDYGIYIIEQAGHDPFNQGKLQNVGFVEALKQHNYECFFIHDIDLVPQDDRNLYTCAEYPRHVGASQDKFKYRYPYQGYFGGAVALTKEHMELLNGYSNEYWGWGGEDDDIHNRIFAKGLKITRYSMNVARYTHLGHRRGIRNPMRHNALYDGVARAKTDGLNSLKYKRLQLEHYKLYTWVLVDLLYNQTRRTDIPIYTGHYTTKKP
ncbi:beta-1,4-N-acetylgalactosaminyltransferase bre-4-like isoform X2 [Ornithodoros turicata]